MLRNYGDYGFNIRIGCGEWDPIVENLGTLLTQAENLMLTDRPQYIAAKSYYDDKTSFWDPNALLTGSQCVAEVNIANTHVSAVGNLIRAAGAAPAADDRPVPPPDPDASNPFSLVKWIVVGAVAISGGLIVAQIAPLIGLVKKKGRST